MHLRLLILRTTQPWMLWWAVGLHFIWGWALLVRPTAGNLTVFVGLNRLVTDVGISSTILGLFLIVASLLAAAGLLLEGKIPRLALVSLLPQYALLLIALLSDLEVVVTAKNPATGQYVDRVLIISIIGPLMWAAILHTFAILERFVLRWSRS